jgi:8-amino-7-oxononanoate synthase
MNKNIARYSNRLDRLKELDNLRTLKDIDIDGKFIKYNGNVMLNLSSNDYLGLGYDKELVSEFERYIDSNKFIKYYTSASSRLLTGNHSSYKVLEDSLKNAFEREAALVFNSGYHANCGILPALTGKNDLILADKLVHASIIDGIRLSKAELIRYRHLDYDHLQQILSEKRYYYDNVFIVSESVFSMDGDIADLQVLADIKNEYEAFLYIDEAHAIGARGLNGLGCSEEQVCIDEIDFIVGTFGKALGSVGAYCICDKLFADYLVNNMRTLIFTTALPPVNVAWTNFLFNKLPEFNNKREHLLYISERLKVYIENLGFRTLGESHIVPLITGSNDSCVEFSNKLQESGFFALPVRHPTVPKGSSRIRFSLNSEITDNEMDKLIYALEQIK